MKQEIKKKFRLESTSDKIELYSSSVLDNVNKKGKGKKEQNKEKENIMVLEKIYILELGKL